MNQLSYGGENKTIELETGYPNRWMEMPLDHFNLFDNRTWKMRYLVDAKYFEFGNPLFIEVGGEWTIQGAHFIKGQFNTLAQHYKGMQIETEHRYYGKSLPFSTDFATENLKYLQIEQALEDLAYFIEHFKSITPGAQNSKVILHGCSYPGILVTWMRLRFPHIVDISYASSAPLGLKLQYPEFYEVINDVYANVSSACIKTIKQGFEQTVDLLDTTDGREQLRNALRNWNCGDVGKMGVLELFSIYRVTINVMNDPMHYEDVSCLILSMDTNDKEPYECLADFITLKSHDIGICPYETPSPKSEVEFSEKSNSTEEEEKEEEEEEHDNKNKRIILQENIREMTAWHYQMCTELGIFTTLNRTNSRQPFAIDYSLQDHVKACVDNFGAIVTEGVLLRGIESVGRRYGGNKPRVSKVVSVQGTHDPWKHLAVFEDYNSEAPVLVVEGSHCIDIVERNDDPDELLELRKKVRDQISKWINEIS